MGVQQASDVSSLTSCDTKRSQDSHHHSKPTWLCHHRVPLKPLDHDFPNCMSRIPNFQTNPHQRHVPFSLSMSECSRASPFFGRLVHSFLVASHGQFHTRSNLHRHAKCLWVKTTACVCVCVHPANNIQIYPNTMWTMWESWKIIGCLTHPQFPKQSPTTTTFASWTYPD